ncbi:hypothetical protein GQ600_18422 [Phytophthora cactorum]|nr:hypothetical protein GQ600_18422 [Phytophthora cactorum]
MTFVRVKIGTKLLRGWCLLLIPPKTPQEETPFYLVHGWDAQSTLERCCRPSSEGSAAVRCTSVRREKRRAKEHNVALDDWRKRLYRAKVEMTLG